MLLGIAGSLLLARWIKRQTLGMEPADIVALAEQREAIFTGIAEGVLALDPRIGSPWSTPWLPAAVAARNSVGQSLADLGIEGRLHDVLTGQR